MRAFAGLKREETHRQPVHQPEQTVRRPGDPSAGTYVLIRCTANRPVEDEVSTDLDDFPLEDLPGTHGMRQPHLRGLIFSSLARDGTAPGAERRARIYRYRSHFAG